MPAKGWKKAPDGTWAPPNQLNFKIELSDELSGQIDTALELVATKIAVEPISATLGNPVAFPLIAGGVAVFGAVLLLKSKFPAGSPVSLVRDAAKTIAETIQEIIPPIFPPAVEGQPPTTLDTLIENLTDLLTRLWNDPLFGTGGGGPFMPGTGPGAAFE